MSIFLSWTTINLLRKLSTDAGELDLASLTPNSQTREEVQPVSMRLKYMHLLDTRSRSQTAGLPDRAERDSSIWKGGRR